MKKFLLTTIFAFIGLGLFSQEKIAVFPFEDMENIFTKNEAVLFYRNFSNEFANKTKGILKVVPRRDVEKLVEIEAGFQLSNYSEKAKTAQSQKVLNGTQILSGVVGKFGNDIQISVSLYTYPDLWQLPGGVDMTVSSKDELRKKIPELVQAMITEINTPNKTYKIGDTGPAGGIVFYDKGVFSNGWRYLEAAPAGTEVNDVQWGTVGTEVANTMRAVGFGKQNTYLIVERLKQLGESNRAAQLCANLDINGYKDWFLPSIDELGLMFTNLKQKGLGGFSSPVYWSSSQNYEKETRNEYAICMIFFDNPDFNDDAEMHTGKWEMKSVRAIRQF